MPPPSLPPQASCLCGSAPCILCGCCPSSPNSTVSRLLFTSFLFLGVLVSIIMLSPSVESQLHKVSSPGVVWGPPLLQAGGPAQQSRGGSRILGAWMTRRRQWWGVCHSCFL